jgi:hypothetical protein
MTSERKRKMLRIADAGYRKNVQLMFETFFDVMNIY